jgi:hypothetical protein
LGELENQFARNFRSTYKLPASLEEIKSCVHQKGETLRSYIQRWSVIKNSAEDPKGFKSPHDQEKYDGSQEPTLWLSDYLQAVQILGGTRATAMQSLQLHLTSAARSWLNTLPKDSIRSWGELENQFTRNFLSTYKRPALLEEIKSCVQQKGETLLSYIHRWSVIKNSAEDVSDERAIDAFLVGFVVRT